MRTLDPVEIDVLMEFFAPDGYVLDLSDERFNELTQRAVGVRVKDAYAEECLSKGKSLRRFVTMPGNEERGYKLLTSLMRYYEVKIKDSDSPSVRADAQYKKCKDILMASAPVNTSEPPKTGIEEAKGKLQALYKDGSYFSQSSSETKVPIALENLTRFVKACVAVREVRVFSNPLFIRTVCELADTAGDSMRPAETTMAEGEWKNFINALGVVLMLIERIPSCPFDVAHFKAWLKCRTSVSERAGGFNFFRSIAPSAVSELRDECKRVALSMHPQHAADLEVMYCGVFDNEWERYDFLPLPSLVESAAKKCVKPSTFIVSPPVKTADGYDRKIERDGGVYHDLMDDAEYYEEREAEIKEECDRRVRLIDLDAENERRHREVMARLDQPLTAKCDGFTAQGKREAVVIANTKMKERDYFSDPNLRILFGVSENVPRNWRTGKSPAPEGFAEAFEKKDYAAMQKCAERYKANRDRSDVMNTKGVVHNISDEQMKKMGAKMPDGYCGDPQ